MSVIKAVGSNSVSGTAGDMSAGWSTGPIQISNGRRVAILAKYAGTGNPSGFFGVRLGPEPGHYVEITPVSGDPDFKGTHPSGLATAGAFWMDFDTAAQTIELFYTPSSGGTGSTCQVWVMWK